MLTLVLPLVCLATAPAPGDTELGGFLCEYTDIGEPRGAVFAPDGRLLLAEAERDRILLFDAERHRVGVIGKHGSAPGELSDPHGLALAPDGELYVADTGNDRISVFRLDGTFVRVIGVRGGGPSEFRAPEGVAVDARRLYVADTRNHRVQVFDREGHWERAFGGFGDAPGRLCFPADLAVEPQGRLLVADTDNHRIQAFDAQGRALAQWGVFGPFQGQLAAPTCVRVLGERIYVADRDNHRIEVFDRAGKRVHGFGLHALQPHEGAGKLHYPSAFAVVPDGQRILVVEGFENRAQLFGPISASELALTASQERNTAAHFGGALDAAGVLVAAVEPSAPGIVLYDTTLAEPVEITRLGGYGHRIAQFVRPGAIELDPSAAHAYVADAGNARLLDFLVDRPPGEPLKYDPALARLSQALDLRQLAEAASAEPDLVPEPVALECAGDGTLFVLDQATERVLELTPRFAFVRAFDARAEPAPSGSAARARRPSRLVDLAVNARGTELFVLDALSARVRVFDRAGKPLRAFGQRGEEAGELLRPAGIACAPDGTVWIADEALHRILHVDAGGQVLATVGREGLARGEFAKPRGLAFDPAGHLVVLDWGNHRGQVLDTEGHPVSAFGSRAYLQPPRVRPGAPKRD